MWLRLDESVEDTFKIPICPLRPVGDVLEIMDRRQQFQPLIGRNGQTRWSAPQLLRLLHQLTSFGRKVPPLVVCLAATNLVPKGEGVGREIGAVRTSQI